MILAPYGYRISRGKACAEPREAMLLDRFYRIYLSGSSVAQAGRAAGILRCRSCLAKMLRNKVYLGNSYYPQLIDKELFDAVQEERSNRCILSSVVKRTRHYRPIPVQTRFRLIKQPVPPGLDPVRKAAFLYSCIKAVPAGNKPPADIDRTKNNRLT